MQDRKSWNISKFQYNTPFPSNLVHPPFLRYIICKIEYTETHITEKLLEFHFISPIGQKTARKNKLIMSFEICDI